MNLQLHLPTAIWEGEQGIHVGNLEPESVQDKVGAEAWGDDTKSVSIAARRENVNSKQMKHLSHFNNIPPQGHYQKSTHVLFLS